jgi:hypothetical protein
LYLQHLELPSALDSFVTGLRHYATSLGKGGLYHATITYAYLFLIHERIHRLAHPHDWTTFHQHNPDLFVYPSPLLAQLYHQDTLSSDLARQIFVLPDRSLPHPATTC